MALDTIKEDKIRMPDGTTISRSNLVKMSIDFYKESYQDNLTDICDFSDGSEIRTLHESWAIELFAKFRHAETKAKQKYVLYATGTYLDMLACEYHLTRKRGVVAKGSVTFSTTANINGTIIIPRGTVILARDTGFEYILQEDIYITSPNTPVNGTVYSKLIGSEYNADINKLTAFKNIESIRTEVKVTNSTPITGGEDGESDESLRDRILKVKQASAYGTAPVYQSLLQEEVEDVHDIQFVDSIELTQDSSYPRHYKEGVTTAQISGKSFANIQPYLCTDCSAVLFVNTYTKPIPTSTINSVTEIMTSQTNLVIGQKFHIEKAGLQKIYFAMELFVTTIVSEDIINEHLTAFFNGGDVETKTGVQSYHGLYIGEALEKSRLIDVLEDIPGIHQVGYLKLIKYSTNVPTEINQWNNNGDSGFTYHDDDGYVYWRRYSTSQIPLWGSKNFVSIDGIKGKVFSLGDKSSVDSSTNTKFTIYMKKVDEKGELI